MLNKDTYGKFGKRNSTMYRNMMRQIERDGIKKFVTFCGMNHGNMSRSGRGALCYRLAKNERYKNKLMNIEVSCKNCYDRERWLHKVVPYKGPITYCTDSLLMNSIYEKYFDPPCKYTLIATGLIDNEKVKKYSGYLILMKDQPEF